MVHVVNGKFELFSLCLSCVQAATTIKWKWMWQVRERVVAVNLSLIDFSLSHTHTNCLF